MNYKRFSDYHTILNPAGGPIPVSVMASALHALWSDATGPQTEHGLFEASRALFEDLIADKLLLQDLEDGIVVFRDVDLDT